MQMNAIVHRLNFAQRGENPACRGISATMKKEERGIGDRKDFDRIEASLYYK